MINFLKKWLDKYMSDPEAIMLLIFICGGLSVIMLFGKIFTPVFVALTISILLRYWIDCLKRFGFPYTIAYIFVYISFITILFGGLLLVIPLLYKQCINFLSELPVLIKNSQFIIISFIKKRKYYISDQYLDTILNNMLIDFQSWGRAYIASTFAAIPGIISWIVYLILMPLMVFFFLKDQEKIILWLSGFLPEKSDMMRKVWHEMIKQMEKYIRGKVTEISIVAIVTYLVFVYFNLDYALLLASCVGLSVVIPYIGAVVVTIPVLIVGYLQWGITGGFSGNLALLIYAYLFVQFLDGNILVPFLFSEAVDLHPIAIIIAILFFGAIWGFWGIFFAIPLATLVKSVIHVWPHKSKNYII